MGSTLTKGGERLETIKNRFWDIQLQSFSFFFLNIFFHIEAINLQFLPHRRHAHMTIHNQFELCTYKGGWDMNISIFSKWTRSYRFAWRGLGEQQKRPQNGVVGVLLRCRWVVNMFVDTFVKESHIMNFEPRSLISYHWRVACPLNMK